MKTTERLEQLQAQLHALDTDELWQRWLAGRRYFHTYSFRNQWLIAMQAPETIAVAGFRVWQDKFNRRVKKGEKAIWILAPTPIKTEEVNEKTGENIKRMRFKPVPVFTYESTEHIDGLDEIPVSAPLEPIEGASHAYYIEPLECVAYELGVSRVITNEYLGQARGSYRPRDKSIRISSDCAENEAVAVLAHELCHHMVREWMADDDKPDDYAHEEVLVEATAHCICATIGLDTSYTASRYVASWGAEDITTLARNINELARSIEGPLAKHIEDRVPA